MRKTALVQGLFSYRGRITNEIKQISQKIRKIIVPYLEKLLREKYPSIDKDLKVDVTASFFQRIPSTLFGRLYAIYKKSQEWLRVWFYNFFDSLSNLRILYEILFHSRSLIVLLVILFVVSLSPYLLNLSSFSIGQNFINTLLIAYVGGATAILGIIFALYAVGFQTTTERFSSNVTDYLNREKVGKFFFKLLTLSAVFSLLNLVIQEGVIVALVLPFTISTTLFVISLIGIIIFKDDYMTKLKPKQVFQRIYEQNIETLRFVNDFDYPNIATFSLITRKNIKHFKTYLPIHNSWSLVMSLQKQLDDRLEINENLYDDLIREGRIGDATFGIVALGYLLAEYSTIKHFIDRKWAWWFPVYQEVVTAESAEMLPLKANYEAMGIGRLGVTKRDYDWLEDNVLTFFKRIQTKTDFAKYPLIGNALISAYETILAGRFVKTEKGLEKQLRGCFENQEFALFDKTIKQFVDFGEKITGIRECEGNFLNSLGQVKTVCVDGFSQRSFPGRLNDWKPHIVSKIRRISAEGRLLVTREDVVSWKLPSYFHSVIIDAFEKLEVETLIEGCVVTPNSWLEKDIVGKIEAKETEIVAKYRQQTVQILLTLSNKQGSQFYKDYSGGIILGLFNQLISQERWNELESIIKFFYKDLLVYFASVDHEKFLEQEYREPIDFGVFGALTQRKKLIFVFYLRLFIMSQFHLFLNRKGDDTELLLKIARRPLMLGGLAYLISELDQDTYYVVKFTQEVEKLYPNVNLAEIYRYAVDATKKLGFGMSFRITYEEANRYRHYFRRVINSISDLPRDYIVSGGVSFGISSRETVKHPSEFIRKMAEFRFSDMDECEDGYVEWLEKREKIKELIKVLKLKQS